MDGPVIINAGGFYVYHLWGTDPATPVYTGQSERIMSRLGSHWADPSKRGAVRNVQLIECSDAAEMRRLEKHLIATLRPTLNRMGV